MVELIDRLFIVRWELRCFVPIPSDFAIPYFTDPELCWVEYAF
jgi:hypothetical protein